MNEYLKNAIDLLKRDRSKVVVIEITKEDRSALKRLIDSYIKADNTMYVGNWTSNLSDESQLDRINYIFLSIEERSQLVMRKQEMNHNPRNKDIFFPKGTFFNSEKGKKKKLEL